MKFSYSLLTALFLIPCAIPDAKTRLGQKLGLGVEYGLTEGFTLGVGGSALFGHHMEQIDLFNPVYDSGAASGGEFFAAGKVHLGRIGNAWLSGTGEVQYRHRAISDLDRDDDTVTAASLKEYVPRVGLVVDFPMVSGFLLRFGNLFERRLIVSPERLTSFVWRPMMALHTPPISPLSLSAFGYYEGHDIKDVKYMAETAFGIDIEPLQALHVRLSDNIQWRPELPGVMHGLTLQVRWVFGRPFRE